MEATKTLHTPGPWSTAEGSLYVYSAEGNYVADAGCSNVYLGDEARANRNLIAAAPDLLEALIAAKRELWDIAREQWNLEDFNNWAVVQQINAALEKADGKPRTEAAIAKAEGK